MGRFRIFKKGQPDEPLCNNLTLTQDCSLVSEIREAQQELMATEEKIKQFDNREFDMVEIMKVLYADELYHIYNKIYNNRYYNSNLPLTVQDMLYVQEAVGHIGDFDKFVSEVKTILQQRQLLAVEQKKATELRAKISKAKETLGIK